MACVWGAIGGVRIGARRLSKVNSPSNKLALQLAAQPARSNRSTASSAAGLLVSDEFGTRPLSKRGYRKRSANIRLDLRTSTKDFLKMCMWR